MKKLLLFLFLTSFSVYSQIPAGYYDTATGSGYTLKTQLYNIIKGHTDNDYSGLWITYQTSDIDLFYENDGTIMDIYSENPTAADPYNFTVTTNQCGTYSVEGNCYNREHIVPQSVFNQLTPMRNDAHFIIATDGKVNGMRSNYPHGMVGTATNTSQNGSKVGSALNSGYSAGYSGTVFEPIDEFKGDVARYYFYFATRYENVLTTWGVPFDMFDGTTDQVFAEPFLTILMTWHTQDPVSNQEIARNDAIYARQNNRNPFIDHPEYVNQIWSTTSDTQSPTAPTNLISSNITNTTVDLNWTASTDDVGVTSYAIFVDGLSYATSVTNSATLTGLTQNTSYAITVYAKDAAGNTSTVSNTVNVTTTNVIDVDAPTVPTSLVVSNETSSTLDLAWTASTDNVGVTGYDVYVDGVFDGTTSATIITITGLSPTTTYSLTVLAKDAANNSSAQSTPVNGTTTALSSNCASETFTNSNAPTGSYGDGNFIGDNSVTWTYIQSRDDEGYVITGTGLMLRNTSSKLTSSTVTGGIGDFTCSLKKAFTGTGNRQVELFINGASYGTSIAWDNTTVQTFTVPNINITGGIIVEIRNTTAYQVVIDDLSWTCYASPDTQTPTAIVDLAASNTTSTTTDLAWSASTDNVGVTSYEVFKDGVFLASTVTNAYNVTGLTASTSYNFTVYAKDAAGNTSTVSNTASVTTTTASSVINELFISEYVEGSGNNKAIEIANFTGVPVDLSNYSIKKQINGAGNWGDELILSGTLNTSDVYVIGNSSAVSAVTSVSNITVVAPIDFNGNDPIGLFKNGVLIDIVGVFDGGSVDFAKDVTKRRIGTITSPNTTYTLSEWDDFAIDTFSDLGVYSVTLSVYEFIPNLFSVYPNPATAHKVTILVEDNIEINTIQFYNLLGQQIISIQQPKIIQNRIEIQNIPTGMYVVKIANENSYSIKRLIVQ